MPNLFIRYIYNPLLDNFLIKHDDIFEKIDTKLLSHFPLKKGIVNNVCFENIETFQFFASTKYNKKKVNIEIEKFNYIKVSALTDSEFIYFNDFNTNKKFKSHSYIIPNYNKWFIIEDKNDLFYAPKDLTFYIIEMKPGVYLKRYEKTNIETRPEEWKHGFSRGIAVSEEAEAFVYWLVIW